MIDKLNKVNHDFNFKYVNGEFFIIDSDYLNLVNSKLYGFTIINNEIIQNENITSGFEPSPLGTFVYVEKTNKKIYISQDFNGSYGIYLFEHEDKFIISNSFFKLVNYVKKFYPISFNKEYADAFIAADFCSLIYYETMVNEIKLLPRNYKLDIDIFSKKLNIVKINYGENSIPINSKEGMNILDSWFDKWIKIIRSIKQNYGNFSFDLSGGFDSRLMLTLMLSANIDLNDIHINSIDDSKHEEDFEIASKIAETYGFTLNKKLPVNRRAMDLENMISNSVYSKLGVHKQFYFRYFYNIIPEYVFTGYGGECLRYHWKYSEDEFISLFSNKANKKSSFLSENTGKILKRTFSKLKEDPNLKNNPVGLPDVLFREVLCAIHFGRGSVENYLVNTFNLSPLLDPDVHQLRLSDDECDDKNLLISIIFSRYAPKLLDFKFEKGRSIDKKTIEYAFRLNETYPYKKNNHDFIKSKPNTFNKDDSFENAPVIVGKPNKFISEVFLSDKFRSTFEFIYSKELYGHIVELMKKLNFNTTEDIYVGLASNHVFNAVEYSLNNIDHDPFTLFENYLKDISLNYDIQYPMNLLSKYNTARIDFKNMGIESNSVEIIGISDNSAKCYYPLWFTNQNGKGLVVESSKGTLDLKLKCIGDGELQISLRGIDYRNEFDDRLPIFINFNEVQINNLQNYENKLVWCDSPYNYTIKVKDNEIVDLHFKWLPLGKLN